MANKHKGQVAFPEMGQGAYLRFTWDDLAELEEHFGLVWHTEIISGLQSASIKTLRKLMEVGLKNAKGERIEPHWDSVVVEDVIVKASEAYHLAIHGKTVKEVNEEARKEGVKEGDKEEPAPGPQIAAA